MRIEQLLEELCTQLGFCLAPDEQARIIAAPPNRVDDFTDEVFRAEGLDPIYADGQLRADVREMVAAFFEEPNPAIRLSTSLNLFLI